MVFSAGLAGPRPSVEGTRPSSISSGVMRAGGYFSLPCAFVSSAIMLLLLIGLVLVGRILRVLVGRAAALSLQKGKGGRRLVASCLQVGCVGGVVVVVS